MISKPSGDKEAKTVKGSTSNGSWIFLVKFFETIPPSSCCSSCFPHSFPVCGHVSPEMWLGFKLCRGLLCIFPSWFQSNGADSEVSSAFSNLALGLLQFTFGTTLCAFVSPDTVGLLLTSRANNQVGSGLFSIV